MEKLLNEISDLVIKAINDDVIPPNCTLHIAPEGCKIISEDGKLLWDNSNS